ncbi:hypothetical protein GCM10023317_69240 [Actinopolymorpha pittospori]
MLATVRVRVYKAEAGDGAAPVAVAYLGEFDRSRRSRDLGRGPHQASTPHQRRRDRMRARLRLPRPRPHVALTRPESTTSGTSPHTPSRSAQTRAEPDRAQPTDVCRPLLTGRASWNTP